MSKAAVHQLSRADARRIAVRAQVLTKQRPTDVVETVRALSRVQVEPTKAIAPSADLVLWSRLGSAYDPQALVDAVDQQRLVDFRGMLLPADEMVLHRAEMSQWPGTGELLEWQEHNRDWVATNNDCRREILALLRTDGPLPAHELPDACVRPWRSSGWNNNRNVMIMLDFLVQRGEVACAGWDGRDRLWDLAERVYPDEEPVPVEEARRLRDVRRLRAIGISRARRRVQLMERVDAYQAGEPAVVDGVRGRWLVDPELLGQKFTGRAALLSPFDRLMADRKRVSELFECDYILEMYKPVAKRRFGYYALPILYGDRLVGKLDAHAHHDEGALRVHAIHRDVEFTTTMTAAVDREINDLARWLDLDLVREQPDLTVR